MARNSDEKLERIREIMGKLDGFYQLRERNDDGYIDLGQEEADELIEEMETLVNS
jgi:hypothetical protein